jgi:hypothetical protein
MALQHLRSSTADKRPTPAAMSDGQLALNTNLVSPGLFFKDSNGDSVKIGPVHVGTTAPNVTPGAGGQAGNSKGEQWLDTSSSRYVFKIWDGTAWRSEDGEFVNVSGDTMTGALGIIAGTAAAPGVFFSGDPNTGIFSPGADQVAVATNGTGRLFVGSTGNIGLSEASPTARLHIAGTNTVGGIKIVDSSLASAAPGIEVIGKRSDSNVSSGFAGKLLLSKNRTDAAINSTNVLGSVAFGGNHTDGTEANILYSASIVGAADGAFNSATDMPTALVFNTGATGRAPDTAGVTTGTERLRITSAGLVGIGTSAPATTLDVNGDITISDKIIHAGDTNTAIRFPAADTVTVETGGAERTRIDSSGRLLVGTSSAYASYTGTPSFQLSGIDISTGSSLYRVDNNATSTVAPVFTFGRTRGATKGTHGLVSSGDYLGFLAWTGSDGTNFIPAVRIDAQVDGTPGANDMPGRLVFSTTADGASTPTERMRIRQEGAIDTLTAAGSSLLVRNGTTAAGNAILGCVNGATNLGNGTTVFVVRGDGDCENTNNSYGALSDIKLKENIVDATSQWDDLKALQVRKYNFKEDTSYGTHTQIGLIAQEVELVSPGLVSESPDRDEDGNDLGTVTKSVNYSVLYMKAVKALQEAMERIEALEARIAALEV